MRDRLLRDGERTNPVRVFGFVQRERALLAKNDDDLFPEFRGRDLSTALGREIPVVHRAEDGATVAALPLQIGAGPVPQGTLTMLTIGGNDLLQGLSRGAFSLERFGVALREALARLSGTQLSSATSTTRASGTTRTPR